MRSARKSILIGLGIAGILVMLAQVMSLFCTWTPVVLMHAGSRSERQYLDRLAQEGIGSSLMADIMVTELTVRRFRAERAVRIAREIDATGDKIVVTYPHYPFTATGEMKMPHDMEKP